MSGSNQLVCGIGAQTGPQLALEEPLSMSGNCWYVDFASGVDSVVRGLERKAPLKTLAQAVANSAAGDIIVMLETHDETITAPVTVDKSLTVLAEGKAEGRPTAKLTLDSAMTSGGMLIVEGAGTRLLNIWFNEPLQAALVPNVSVRAVDVRLEELYMECGENNNEAAIGGNGTACTRLSVDNSYFLSVSEDVEDRPLPAIKFDSGENLDGFKMSGTTFDGGTVGWFDADVNKPYAMNISETQALIECEAISLLRGADMALAAATTGYVNVSTCTGGARLVW